MINFSTAPQNRAILGYLSRKSGNFGLLSNITKACKSAEWHEVNLIYVSRRCLNYLKSLQERSRFQVTTRVSEPWFLKPPAFEKETQAGHTDPHPRGGVSFPAAEARGGSHNIPPHTSWTISVKSLTSPESRRAGGIYLSHLSDPDIPGVPIDPALSGSPSQASGVMDKTDPYTEGVDAVRALASTGYAVGVPVRTGIGYSSGLYQKPWLFDSCGTEGRGWRSIGL